MTTLDLDHTGLYDFARSIDAAAGAAFIGRPPASPPERPTLDLAFPLDGVWSPIGVRIVTIDGRVQATVTSNPDDVDPDTVRGQLRRMLSLEPDGRAFAAIGVDDQVVGELQRHLPGLRPMLFPSPYECAARAIIQHRISFRQAVAVAGRIAAAHGTSVQVGDGALHAFPPPDRLARIEDVPGLAARKVEQLRSLGRAAQDRRFTARALAAMAPVEATGFLMRLPGIGPFSAELIRIRGVGDADVFPRTEMSLHRAMAVAYDLGVDPGLDELERTALRWSPFRSWVGLLFRHRAEARVESRSMVHV